MIYTTYRPAGPNCTLPKATLRALLDRLERAEADLDETRFCLGVAASRDPGLIQAIREAPRD